ncbi:hypothetical protein EVAR_54349_1 [Eumeta japonica]|uniref:Uncharacterized protein n=1 Tax=Eumeta variegata TaxID=151549 RepID=A0A4C1Z7P0_EUMVA|nr:hypothetical protein EVAR_54349_1 [Eumeta japonica]
MRDQTFNTARLHKTVRACVAIPLATVALTWRPSIHHNSQMHRDRPPTVALRAAVDENAIKVGWRTRSSTDEPIPLQFIDGTSTCTYAHMSCIHYNRGDVAIDV